MKKLVAFDLDGTLAESKQGLDDEMAGIFAALSHVADIYVISGGDWPQFEKQVAGRLTARADLSRSWLMPTTGTKLYRYESDRWVRKFGDLFSPEESDHIIAELRASIDQLGFAPEEIWGEQIEDRGSQITSSALGQEAPFAPKETWDPKQEKRRLIQADLQPRLPEVSVRIGGSISIDITRKGVDKAYGIERLAELSALSKDEMLFFWRRSVSWRQRCPCPGNCWSRFGTGVWGRADETGARSNRSMPSLSVRLSMPEQPSVTS